MVSYTNTSWFNRFWCVWWRWHKSPYLTDYDYFWTVDKMPCVGCVKKLDGGYVEITSGMGNKWVFHQKQVAFFDTEKEARQFRDQKQKELYSQKTLFNQKKH